MKIQRIQELTDASIVCGSEKRENDVQCAFASDLMSDVLWRCAVGDRTL